MVQIVTLTSSLANTSEDGETTVSLGDIVLADVSIAQTSSQEIPYNQLLNEHSLAYASTFEKTNLSTTCVRCQKVDNLDTGDKDLSAGRLLGELWGVGMDRKELGGLDGTTLVDGVTSNVHDTSKGAVADGDLDGSAGVGGSCTSNETLGT